MPREDNSVYTEKQKRQACEIETSYRDRGIGEDEAQRRAAERSATASKAARTRAKNAQRHSHE